MKQLEDKIRDRLEGYESSLPEGDLSEFKAILNTSAKGASEKRKVTPVAWLAPITAAAVIALLITLGNNQPQSQVPTAVNNHTPTTAKTEVPQEAVPAGNDTTRSVNIPKVVVPIAPQHTYTQTAENDVEHSVSVPTSDLNMQPSEEFAMAETVTTLESQDSVSTIAIDDTTTLLASTTMPSYMSTVEMQQPRHTFKGKTIAGITGGAGVAAALIKYLPSLAIGNNQGDAGHGHTITNPIENGNYNYIKTRYYIPLRVGVSLRVPLNNRWSLTSGVDYSWYYSKMTVPNYSDLRQNVQYIGIPLRADFTLLRHKRLEAYLGAGMAADFCVSVPRQGGLYHKDGVGFSVAGVGGVQFNITKNIGLYLEPTVSWNLPDKKQKLVTYKSLHPVIFSVSPGLRFTLGND